MNVGMQISQRSENSDNMEEVNICQNRIRDALLKLIEKERKPQTPELINHFGKWSLYDQTLLLHPNKASLLTNNIYKLHSALDLEDASQLHEIIEHVKALRALTNE